MAHITAEWTQFIMVLPLVSLSTGGTNTNVYCECIKNPSVISCDCPGFSITDPIVISEYKELYRQFPNCTAVSVAHQNDIHPVKQLKVHKKHALVLKPYFSYC